MNQEVFKTAITLILENKKKIEEAKCQNLRTRQK